MRSAGVTAIAKSGTVTVRLAVVVCVRLPLTPVMVSVLVPPGVAAPVVTTSVDAVPAGFGVKSALAPAGRPVTLRATSLVKPPLGVIAMA